MFKLESEMTPAVIRWLANRGMQVKQEFQTPWGICDLVGLSFDHRNVQKRLRLGQRAPIVSIAQAILLQNIPKEESKQSKSVDDLIEQLDGILAGHEISSELCRLVEENFVVALDSGRYQRVDGGHPIHRRLVAVELKLDRVEEALRQAMNNLTFAPESYVAFPLPVARRVAAKRSRWASYFDQGVGLIGVSPHRCTTLIHGACSIQINNPVMLFCSAEKFWRTRTEVKGISS